MENSPGGREGAFSPTSSSVQLQMLPAMNNGNKIPLGRGAVTV